MFQNKDELMEDMAVSDAVPAGHYTESYIMAKNRDLWCRRFGKHPKKSGDCCPKPL